MVCGAAVVPHGAGNMTHVIFETTKGLIKILVHHDWSPRAAQRFVDLVKTGYFDGIYFTRLNSVLVQFGEHTVNPDGPHRAHRSALPDETRPRPQSENGDLLKRGWMSYAGGGPNTRTTSVFFVTRQVNPLGKAPWEVAFAELPDASVAVVDSLYHGYGDWDIFKCPTCNGPNPGRVRMEGNAYLERSFPKLDKLIRGYIGPDPDSSVVSPLDAIPMPDPTRSSPRLLAPEAGVAVPVVAPVRVHAEAEPVGAAEAAPVRAHAIVEPVVADVGEHLDAHGSGASHVLIFFLAIAGCAVGLRFWCIRDRRKPRVDRPLGLRVGSV